MRLLSSVLLILLIAGCASPPHQLAVPSHAVIGVEDSHLDPEFWIRRQNGATKSVLDAGAIAAQNAKLQRTDPSVYDVEHLPATLTDAQVKGWIGKLSARPTRTLFDEQGREVSPTALDGLIGNLNLDKVPDTQRTRYGIVVHRADLRTFPTRQRVFSSRGDTDIDRFQESALFPGTPVVIVHASKDGDWLFIVSPLYAAWIEKQYVAEGEARQVFDYTRKEPYLVVTGSTARTVFTRERPEVSELQLDMGVRVPVLSDWPADKPVNGQHPYTAHVIELPIRDAGGNLRFTPALLPKNADVATDYLPLNRANLLRQSFKFLGERYGWGHSYNARDCSGFVAEIYRSFGVQLPRNTRDQGMSPALNRLAFTERDSHEERLAVLQALQVGDLIYIPGHVMMVIGHDRGMPYVIHDTTGISYRNNDAVTRVHLNGVSVTPLTPLLLSDDAPLIDRIYSIQRIRPATNHATDLPWSDARQLVLVTTAGWDANQGTLHTYSMTDGKWQTAAPAVPVALGRAGSAWGVGLHPKQSGPIKQEGDGRSPAGVFDIGIAFGYADSAQTALRYKAMTDSDYCIDVNSSPHYNRIVDARVVGKEAIAGSTEPMRRDIHLNGDQRYRIGFVIEHNSQGTPAAGSCIFAHLWKSPGAPTAGCTAMDEPAMQALLAWLQPERHPVFVLLPLREYARLRTQWGLPELERLTK